MEPGMMVGRDITLVNEAIPLVREKTPLTPALIDLMRKHQIRFAYINEDIPRAETHSNSPIYVPQAKPTLSPGLRDRAVQSLEEIYKSSISRDAVDAHSGLSVAHRFDKIVDELVDTIDSGTLINIINLKSYDDYTYHHSLSVAVLSLAIAQGMGMNRNDMRRIAKCAMMHDIGKTAVPIEIIQKPGRLTELEFEAIRSHSKAGYDYLSKSGIGDEEIREVVLHHHEKFDGTGYPRGLTGENIPLWSRIISVADVYDALTSNRPYRSPLPPAEAIEYVMGGIETQFDFSVVEAFIKRLELYPPGSKIRLSNGATAVVYNTENAMRPVVRILPTGEILDLYRDRDCLNLVITEIL
jgi:putative nucleotidyltransferase with HDIG domain